MLLTRHELLEADLARYYPRDDDQLPAFWAGRMTLRRLMVLLRGLPREAHLVHDQVGEAADWDAGAYLLAHVANLLTVANGQRAGKKPKDSEYVRVPKPGKREAREARESRG